MPDLDKVIILLTDGENTQIDSAAPKPRRARTQKACDNIKAAIFKLYTIRVIDGNAALLSEVRHQVEHVLRRQDAANLNVVFGAIATNLASLRIAK